MNGLVPSLEGRIIVAPATQVFLACPSGATRHNSPESSRLTVSSDAWFLEIWKSVKQRNPTPKEKKSIAKATEMGKVFRESGLWDQLLSKYGEERGGRIWDLLVAIHEGDSFKARALFEALENKLP